MNDQQCCTCYENLSKVRRIKETVKDFIRENFLKLALFIIRKQGRSNLVKHAENEFELLGWRSCGEEQNTICDNIVDFLSLHSTQGHSGFSASYILPILTKLLNWEPITPILCMENEWILCHGECYQNKRLGSIFKDGINGDPYYIYAISWRNQDDCCFTGTVEGICSHQFIRLPFTPKTFYVDVIDDNKNGTRIKDRSQLDEVFKYYKGSV